MSTESAGKEILEDIRRVASSLGRRWVSRSEYKLHGRFSTFTVERTFLTWGKAVEAAGLAQFPRRTWQTGEKTPGGWNRISDEALREEFFRVHKALSKIPTINEFHHASKFSADVYAKRFGSWRKAVAHYLGPEAAGLSVARRQPSQASGVGLPATPSERPPIARGGGSGRRVFGAPLNFRELRHEPINEQGVVYLFGMIARELGFLVEGVATEFPDCDAKRRTRSGLYERVRIEFEFKTSNFREHGHDPSGCDLVVCWAHDWPDCPVEVLELKAAIQQLNRRGDS